MKSKRRLWGPSPAIGVWAFCLIVTSCIPGGETGPNAGDEIVSVVVTPSVATVGIDETTVLEATVWNGRGEVVQVPVEWSSADPEIALVDRDVGLVRGVSPGTVLITASAGGVSGEGSVTVRLLLSG